MKNDRNEEFDQKRKVQPRHLMGFQFLIDNGSGKVKLRRTFSVIK